MCASKEDLLVFFAITKLCTLGFRLLKIDLNSRKFLSLLKETAVEDELGAKSSYSSGHRNWTTKVMDFCKSCIDPTRPIGEEVSSEGYATPRSLETPVQMASKCPSLNQIRDPYASRHPGSLRMTEEEKRQRLAKFTSPNYRPQASSSASAVASASAPKNSALEAAAKAKASSVEDMANDNETSSIYTILIKLPPPSNGNSGNSTAIANSASGSTANASSSVCASASKKHRTSIQQLLSEPVASAEASVVMKRCDSEHVRRPNAANRSSTASRTVPTTPSGMYC